jgi:DNA-binding transcriptional MerR regulator
VLLIRRIRELLYREGFTISGARNRLGESAIHEHEEAAEADQLRACVREVRHELEDLLHFLRG